MSLRNYWELIKPLYERGSGRNRLGLYRCGLCKQLYKVVIYNVNNDRTHCCPSCSSRRTARAKWEVTLPNGDRVMVVDLKNWCKSRDVFYDTLRGAARTGRPTRAGYKVKKIEERG